MSNQNIYVFFFDFEDCGTTHAELETLFGKHVADIVAEVSDDKSLSKSTRKKMQIEHAPHMSPEAKTVKLGDKLDNLRSLLTDPPVGAFFSLFYLVYCFYFV